MSEIKEISVNNSIGLISIKAAEIILDQMKNCVCKIHHQGQKGTGFFIKVPYYNNYLTLLIINILLLDINDTKIDNTITISLNNEDIFKEIKLDNKRRIYTNKDLDITIIEIRENEDKIYDFLFLDENILNDQININNVYINESIYILNYKNGGDVYLSYGLLNNIKDDKINKNKGTNIYSSGSPIILLKNYKVIGVHYNNKNDNNLDFCILLNASIKEYIKKYDKIIYDKKRDENNEIKNYIIAEINIKEEDINKEIRIINSFEEFERNENGFNIGKDYYKFVNEKEIKDNCKIKINNNFINFNYYHKFKEKGKYIIEYILTNNLTKTDFMFCHCKSLIKINLSNFNTQKVTNMSSMFCSCKSLTSIDLSNFNTQNVNDMSYMFCRCESLLNLDLSYFNTQNVKNMSRMFRACKSLKNLDLSYFNTHKVTDMSYMFIWCDSLKNINLSNFNTQNVTKMYGMFCDCGSLLNIDLSNFNTENVVDFDSMFFRCNSLKSIDLSNFNTQNANDMGEMFSGCKSLLNLNLSNFNTQNVTNMKGMFCQCYSLKNENVITKDKKIKNQLNEDLGINY